MISITKKTSRSFITSFLVLVSLFVFFPAKAKKVKKTRNLERRKISDLSQFKFKEGLENLSLAHNKIEDLSLLKLPSTLLRLSLRSNEIENIDNLNLVGFKNNTNPEQELINKEKFIEDKGNFNPILTDLDDAEINLMNKKN